MRNTRQFAGRIVAATGLGLSLMAGPLIPQASAQDVGGQIIKVLGGSNSRQGEKNAMRNLGIGLGAAAVYEALNHKNTNALILGAGAALAAKRYEDVRKTQSKENNRVSYNDDNWRRDRDHERYNNDRNDWRRDNDRRDDDDDRWERRRNDYRRDDRNDHRRNDAKNCRPRHDNGKHNGWRKRQ